MPFDGSTFTKPDVFSTVALRDWLRTQDPKAEYDGQSSDNCVLCQWLTAASREPVFYCGFSIYSADSLSGAEYDMRALEVRVARAEPWTFGAALARAEAIIAQASA